MIKYLAKGNDSFYYAIFDNTDDAYAYAEKYNLEIVCFDGYENAVKFPVNRVTRATIDITELVACDQTNDIY